MKIRYLIIFILIFGSFQVLHCQSPDFTGLKVMINPGHGGNDSNDRGMPNGFWESEGNLTKGLWLRDLLEARGSEVIMSRVLNRTEDDLPLSQIAAIANENNVNLFISIHSNAGNQSTNYCMTIFNGKSETPRIPESKVWAKVLWEHLVTNEATFWTNSDPHYIGDLTLNPGWTTGYGVLYPLTVTGIISEGSMHDYKPEMDRLLNIDYRKQEAWNMLFAMAEYFQLPGVEPFGIIGGIIRDSLLTKENYNILNSPDRFEVVNNAVAEIIETGEKYFVDGLNTGYYYFDSLTPGTYNLAFSALDYFTDTIEIMVEANKVSYHNHWLEADKTMPPKIISTNPAQGETIECFDPIRITFNMNMDSASFAQSFSIEPVVSGKFFWDKYYLTVNFQPDIPYEINTPYTVSIDTLAEHQWGVRLDTGIVLSFITGNRNRYVLENSFPAEGQSDVSPYLQFRTIFDAPLNNSSLINAVSILPAEGEAIGTKSASISTIDGKAHYYFSPSEDLEYDKDYTLRLNGSIKDENNIPLVDTLEITFSTSVKPGPLKIIDELDNISTWSIDFASSSGTDPSSFLYKWNKTYRSGNACMMLRYNFQSDNSSCLVKPALPLTIEAGAGSLGIWIWGEMSNNEIYLRFSDETEVLLTPIDFAGWRYCSLQLPEETSELKGLLLLQKGGKSLTGDLYFDAISQPDYTGLNLSYLPEIKVYPNPLAGNQLNIEGIQGEAEYTIFSPDGRLLKKGQLFKGETKIKLDGSTEGYPHLILRLIVNKTTQHSILILNVY